jgi:hypothetical protein
MSEPIETPLVRPKVLSRAARIAAAIAAVIIGAGLGAYLTRAPACERFGRAICPEAQKNSERCKGWSEGLRNADLPPERCEAALDELKRSLDGVSDPAQADQIRADALKKLLFDKPAR